MVARHKSSRSARYRPLPCPWMATRPAVCPVADLAELYRWRWQVETSLARVKTTMQMDVLPSKTVPGVLKDLTIFAIVYNLVRMVMRQLGGTPAHCHGADQRSGCPALARSTRQWDAVRCLARQPYSPTSSGASGQDTAPLRIWLRGLGHRPATIRGLQAP